MGRCRLGGGLRPRRTRRCAGRLVGSDREEPAGLGMARGAAAVAVLHRGEVTHPLRMILSENRSPLFGIMRHFKLRMTLSENRSHFSGSCASARHLKCTMAGVAAA